MIDYTLYLVTEASMEIERMLQTVEAAVKGGVTVVQLREKSIDGKDFYEKAKQLKSLLDSYKVPLIINDRVDIALAIGASGVHCGQKDMPIEAIRSIVPKEMVVGISVETKEQAELALLNGADYVGTGSVFPTFTKNDATPLSKEELQKVTEVNLPVIAIGGIQQHNISEITPYKLAGYAVVSAICSAENPKDAASQLLKTIKN